MKLLLSVLLLIASVGAHAGVDVHGNKLAFVYQLDSDPTSFQFSTGAVNSCGSVYYKVLSPSEAVANRKFAIALLAFEMDAFFSFHDTETCENDIAIVKWVRVVK